MSTPAHPHPLADLLAGLELTPEQRQFVEMTEAMGWDQAAVSLLRTFAAHLVPAQRSGLPAPRYEFETAAPSGADPAAAEGLPSYMTVGTCSDGTPWFHCKTHYTTHYGLVDVAQERRVAVDHVATFHGGERGD